LEGSLEQWLNDSPGSRRLIKKKVEEGTRRAILSSRVAREKASKYDGVLFWRALERARLGKSKKKLTSRELDHRTEETGDGRVLYAAVHLGLGGWA
jgi:hypothetical protein